MASPQRQLLVTCPWAPDAHWEALIVTAGPMGAKEEDQTSSNSQRGEADLMRRNCILYPKSATPELLTTQSEQRPLRGTPQGPRWPSPRDSLLPVRPALQEVSSSARGSLSRPGPDTGNLESPSCLPHPLLLPSTCILYPTFSYQPLCSPFQKTLVNDPGCVFL